MVGSFPSINLSLFVLLVFWSLLLADLATLADGEKLRCQGHASEAGLSNSLPLNSSAFSLCPQVDISLPFPVYYINLEANDKFRRRMEKTFGTVWDLRRVPARRKKDITSLHLKTIRHAYLQGEQFVFVIEDKISPILV